jgi:DNA-binding transcriptional regulator of glucitol operon
VSVRRVLTPRWVLVHAAAVLLVVGFLLLCWWQVSRAASGNLLSFGYAIEWPVFAGFVVFVWLREVRKAVRGEAETAAAHPVPAKPVVARRKRNEAAYDDHDDPALAAYNHYLAWLNANPDRTPAAYPGLPVQPDSPVKQ